MVKTGLPVGAGNVSFPGCGCVVVVTQENILVKTHFNKLPFSDYYYI